MVTRKSAFFSPTSCTWIGKCLLFTAEIPPSNIYPAKLFIAAPEAKIVGLHITSVLIPVRKRIVGSMRLHFSHCLT